MLNPFTPAELRGCSSGYRLSLSWKANKKNALSLRLPGKINSAITEGKVFTYSGFNPHNEDYAFYLGEGSNRQFFVITEPEFEHIVVRWGKENEVTEFSILCNKIRDKYKK